MFLYKIRARAIFYSLFFIHYSLFIILYSLATASPSRAAPPLLSTSVDWEAVSGLRLSEYKITFSGTKPAGTGWEMYILDAFPCYGFAQYTRAWVSAKKNDGFVRANCVRPPKAVMLAYRAAGENQMQGRTDGILSCPANERQVVNLELCDKKSWAEWNKE